MLNHTRLTLHLRAVSRCASALARAAPPGCRLKNSTRLPALPPLTEPNSSRAPPHAASPQHLGRGDDRLCDAAHPQEMVRTCLAHCPRLPPRSDCCPPVFLRPHLSPSRIDPYFDTSAWEFYDLSCVARDKSDDKVLKDAVEAGARIGAIFKEPTVSARPPAPQLRAAARRPRGAEARSPCARPSWLAARPPVLGA